MLMQILLPCSQSSPDMPFRFVHVQYYTGTGSQGGINLKETLGNILMYRRLRHPKFLRCLSHRSFLLNNKICNFYSTLFDIIFQGKSPEISAFYNLCKIVPGHAPILRRHYFIFYTSSYILFSASHISQMPPDRPRSHPARCKDSPTCPADPYTDIFCSFPACNRPDIPLFVILLTSRLTHKSCPQISDSITDYN